MNEIKVVRIITRLNVGGPAKHCFYLFDLDLRYNYKTNLIYGNVTDGEAELSLPLRHASKCHKVNISKNKFSSNDLYFIFYLLKYLYQEHPHIVHTHTAKAGLYGRLASSFINFIFVLKGQRKIKVIHTYHGNIFSGYFNRIVESGLINLERFLNQCCTTKVIAISNSQKNELSTKFKVASLKKIDVIPLGVNLDSSNFNQEIDSFDIRKNLKLSPKSYLVAIIGRIAPIKNHKFFIRIAHEFFLKYKFDVHFIIIGGGRSEDMNEIKDLVNKYNLRKRVHFLGYIYNIGSILKQININCLTSKNEGTPLSIIECMVNKIPCISTPVGGVPDLLSNGRGVMCVNEYDFADIINKLLEDKNMYNNIIEKAYKFVMASYTQDNLLKNMDNLYCSIVHDSLT